MRHIMPRPEGSKDDQTLRVIAAGLEMVRIAALIQQNADALEVIKAFGLEKMLNAAYLTRFVAVVGRGAPRSLLEEHRQILGPWNAMTDSEKAWQTLTTPGELLQPTPPADLLSMEIQGAREDFPLQSLKLAVEGVQVVYSVLAQIYTRTNTEAKLTIVSVQSGSPTIRIDCRGIAEAIAAFRQFLHETWNKIKYKRADELVQNNHAVFSTLAAVEEISRQVGNGGLSPEEGQQFKQVLLSSALSLFEAGALPTDIVQGHREDKKLLQAFMPKLLPGEVEGEKTKTRRKKAKNRRVRTLENRQDFDFEQDPTSIAGSDREKQNRNKDSESDE